MLIEMLPLPLLALDIGSIIFVLFLLFSFIGFISNLMKGNAGNQQRQARGRQPRRGGELQNEIDDFLKEVLGDQQANRPDKRPQQRGQAEFADDDLEVVEESQFRRQQEERERRERERREKERRQRDFRQKQERERREQQRRQQEAKRRRREREKKQAAAPVLFDEEAQRPRKTLKDRHIESGVESHVKTYMAHTVEQQQLERGTVPPIVGEGLPDYSDQSGVDTSSQIAQDLHRILKSPQGVRQAILVNEILSKPKCLQSRSA
jgi:hypothetical protein